jgi:hypothetical protein
VYGDREKMKDDRSMEGILDGECGGRKDWVRE